MAAATSPNSPIQQIPFVEPTGSQPPERGGRAQSVRPEARTDNPYSHHSFGTTERRTTGLLWERVSIHLPILNTGREQVTQI